MRFVSLKKFFGKTFPALGLSILVLLWLLTPAQSSYAQTASSTSGQVQGCGNLSLTPTTPGETPGQTVGAFFSDVANFIGTTISCGLKLGSEAAQKVGEVAKKITELGVPELINTLITETLTTLIGSFIFPIITLLQSLIVGLLDPRNFKFASSPLIHEGWYLSLQLGNLIIVLGLLILANKIIWGMEGWGDYQKLISYIYKAILINFSLTIASLFVGLSNLLTVYFLGLSSAPTAARPFDTTLNVIDRVHQIQDVFVGLSEHSVFVLGAIFDSLMMLIFGLVLIVIFAVIVYALFSRIIALWIMLIFAPLAWTLDMLGVSVPGVGGVEKQWWDKFINAIAFPPLMAFFLWFDFFFIERVSTLYATTPEAGAEGSWIARLMEAFIFLGILLFGYDTASKAGGEFVPKWGKQWIDKVTGWAPGVGKKWSVQGWKGIQGAYTRASSAVKKQVAETGVAKRIENASAGTVFAGVGKTLSNWRTQSGESLRKLAEPLASQYGDTRIYSPDQLWQIATNSDLANSPEQAAAISVLNQKHVHFLKDKLASAQYSNLDDRYKLLSAFRNTARNYNLEFKPEAISKEAAEAIFEEEVRGKNIPLTVQAKQEYASAIAAYAAANPVNYRTLLQSPAGTAMARQHLQALREQGMKDQVKAVQEILPSLETNTDDYAELIGGMTGKKIMAAGWNEAMRAWEAADLDKRVAMAKEVFSHMDKYNQEQVAGLQTKMTSMSADAVREFNKRLATLMPNPLPTPGAANQTERPAGPQPGGGQFFAGPNEGTLRNVPPRQTP